MEAFSFFLRTMIYTVLLIMVMQIRWDDQTIEDHVMVFMTTSPVVKPLNVTAKGAVIFVRNTWTKISQSINTNFSRAIHSDNQPGSRRFSFFTHDDHGEEAATVRSAARTPIEEVKDFDSHETFQKIRQKAVTTGRNIKAKFIDETKTPKDPTAPSYESDPANQSKTRVKTQPSEEGSVLNNGDE